MSSNADYARARFALDAHREFPCDDVWSHMHPTIRAAANSIWEPNIGCWRTCICRILLKIPNILSPCSFAIELQVPRKLPHRKTTQIAMSPLLRSLTYAQAALGPVVTSMLLRCYSALDAFRRGYGSRELFAALGRHVLMAEELARRGYEAHALSDFELAHAALMHLNEAERRGRGWTVCDTDYVEICAALAVYSEQLSRASLIDIAKAEAAMLEGLLRSSKTSEQVLEAA